MLNITTKCVKHKSYVWNKFFLKIIYFRVLDFQKRIYTTSKKCDTNQTHTLQKHFISNYNVLVLAIEYTLNNLEKYYWISKKKDILLQINKNLLF